MSHDIFLEQLGVAFDVRLVARLYDPEVVGNTNERYVQHRLKSVHTCRAVQVKICSDAQGEDDAKTH